MDNLKENQVLLQLINHKNDEKQDKLPEYPFYDDTTISQISKTISDVIYDPKTSKKQRDCFIGLINKWTGNSHLINDNNQHIFVNILPKTNKTTCDFYAGDFSKPDENPAQILTKTYKNSLQTKIKSGLIDMYHKKVFDNTFDINIPVKPLQSSNAESVIDFLHNLSESKTELSEINTELSGILTEINNKDYNMQVVLAVLHLGEINRSNEQIIIKLVEELAESKTESVVGFIQYIWDNKLELKLTPEICKILLINYQFLYERVVLQYFTLVLNDSDEIQNELNEILIWCFRDVRLTENMLHLLDTMLVLSSFDLRVLKAINLIQNKYLS